MTEHKVKKYQIYIWCCDLYSNTGEGRLAYLFIDYLCKITKKSIKITTYKNNFDIKNKIPKNLLFESKKINFNLFRRYGLPFLGIFMLWINYFKNKQLFYINYLPFWNIFIFLLSPPKTNFGPVTGSLYFGKVYNLDKFIRKYIFYILYKISFYLLLIRKKKIIFATKNLYHLSKNTKYKRNLFNFQILYLYNKKIVKIQKKIDFLIYYRKHINKNYNYLQKLLNHKMLKKIYCIGDNFYFENVYNLGVVRHIKALNLLAKARYTFITSENYQSFYCMDSIINSTDFFLDKNNPIKISNNFSNFISFKRLNLTKSLSNKIFYYKVDFVNKKKLEDFHKYTINFLKNCIN